MQLIPRGLPRLALVAVALLIGSPAAAAADAPAASEAKTIVFVCRHGVVNSQMAAAYFNKVAKERGLPYTAVSRGIDTHWSVPVRIQDGLALDGLEPANAPDDLRADEATRAFKVLAFDTIPAERQGNASVTYWPGVPLGIDDYQTTRDEIARRVDDIISTLPKPP
jgi:arsenate reductase (thioredoxin)